jgi:hypothetical protein
LDSELGKNNISAMPRSSTTGIPPLKEQAIDRRNCIGIVYRAFLVLPTRGQGSDNRIIHAQRQRHILKEAPQGDELLNVLNREAVNRKMENPFEASDDVVD